MAAIARIVSCHALVGPHVRKESQPLAQMHTPPLPDASSESTPATQHETPRELTLLSRPPTTRGKGGVPLSESLLSSLHSLSANVLRTALTMLGIIIGVGA